MECNQLLCEETDLLEEPTLHDNLIRLYQLLLIDYHEKFLFMYIPKDDSEIYMYTTVTWFHLFSFCLTL